jgi:hypothetical protein
MLPNIFGLALICGAAAFGGGPARTWPAYRAFDEQKLGTLEVGKLADLVVLDRDHLTCPDKDIAHLSVVRTIVGGRTVFQK